MSFKTTWPVYLFITGIVFVLIKEVSDSWQAPPPKKYTEDVPDHWVAPSLHLDDKLEGEQRKEVIYGEDLVANTARYFGPHGSLQQITNGMNCQNCHLQAGRLAYGNNYGAVASTYPKFRDRSGSVETISKRVNDCFERSLNGSALDTNGREMKAIVAYIKWIGEDVKKGDKPKGSGITELPYMDRAADPAKGKEVYVAKCQTCHGADGEGVLDMSGTAYAYPPVWGKNSYNTGAGLFRISRFAGYVKDNMPYGQATHKEPALSSEEAWDVAAFVNSQPRPQKDVSNDWPDVSKKPIDHPFGPYADGFNEKQHKYGPFQPIVDKRKQLKEEVKK